MAAGSSHLRGHRLPEGQVSDPSTGEVCRGNSELQLKGLCWKLFHGNSSAAGNNKRCGSCSSLGRGVSWARSLRTQSII